MGEQQSRNAHLRTAQVGEFEQAPLIDPVLAPKQAREHCADEGPP
jgi:hypothetical protein